MFLLIYFLSKVIFLYFIFILFSLLLIFSILYLLNMIFCYCYPILLSVKLNLLHIINNLRKNQLQPSRNSLLLKTCFKKWEFIVFQDEFLRKGISILRSFSIFLSPFYLRFLDFGLLLIYDVNLNAFLMQYFTISYLVLRNFLNLVNKVLKTYYNLF